LSGERTAEGFFRIRPGLGVEYAIARSLAYAPYADLLWWETSEPDLAEAERFAEAIHREFPDRLLAYNCSPSFNWRKNLAHEQLASFQRDIAGMGYRFQFVTLAGFHSLNLAMFSLACNYRERGMAAYSELQQAEFAAEAAGYTATRHQREVGVGYFDAIAMAISGGLPRPLLWPAALRRRSFTNPKPAPALLMATTKVWCTTTTGPCTIGQRRVNTRSTLSLSIPAKAATYSSMGSGLRRRDGKANKENI
jgi:isocitrate lyase